MKVRRGGSFDPDKIQLPASVEEAHSRWFATYVKLHRNRERYEPDSEEYLRATIQLRAAETACEDLAACMDPPRLMCGVCPQNRNLRRNTACKHFVEHESFRDAIVAK